MVILQGTCESPNCKSRTALSLINMEEWLKERALLTRVVQQQLLRAQQRMKAQADKKRTGKEFQASDMVYLRPQPHVQSSVAFRSNKKLAFNKFYGPLKILQWVGGKVAYKLNLPPEAKIHPVVHTSQLKLHIPTTVHASEDLCSVCTDPDNKLSTTSVSGKPRDHSRFFCDHSMADSMD